MAPIYPGARGAGLMLSAIAAFGRFWYRFIVSDDWTKAATVFLGLAVTYAMRRAASSVWWLMLAVGGSGCAWPQPVPCSEPQKRSSGG